MRRFSSVAFLATVVGSIIAGAPADAATRHAIESDFNYKWTFDGNNTVGGGGGSNLADVNNANPWQKKGNAAGLADPLFGYNSELTTGSAALSMFPRTDNAPAPRNEFVQFRLPTNTNSWVYKADYSWAHVNNRTQNMGLKWRNDIPDTDGAMTYTNEGSWEGAGASSTSPTLFTALPTYSGAFPSGNNNNWVGQNSVSGGNPTYNAFCQLSWQIQYNTPDDPGKLNIYYKSLYAHTGNVQAGALVTWNNDQGAPGSHGPGWVLCYTATISAVANINEIALGGSLVNGFGQVTYDNIYFRDILTPVPEPSTMVLLGLAVPAVGLAIRRRRAK